jgi:UDP-N-acetyl-D-mannosaminuronate dehydrogenase
MSCLVSISHFLPNQQRVAVLGFAFKADTGDTRESASITLIRDFISERAYVNLYDPKVTEDQIWLDLVEACPTVPLEQRAFIIQRSLIDDTDVHPSQKAGQHQVIRHRRVHEGRGDRNRDRVEGVPRDRLEDRV